VCNRQRGSTGFAVFELCDSPFARATDVLRGESLCYTLQTPCARPKVELWNARLRVKHFSALGPHSRVQSFLCELHNSVHDLFSRQVGGINLVSVWRR